ncbi:MAG: IPT/TIG domain-containing protein [Candidatus Paceibacterota bacterium]|jgi:hypothetical protein
MKNITKKLISVLTLVVIFSMIGANVSLAAFSKTVSLHVAPSHSGGSIQAVPPSGQMIASGPIVSSVTVTNLTQTSAVLHGIVNPNGVNTLASFFTLSSGPLGTVNVGSGNAGVSLPDYPLTGLNPGNLYQFKVVATDANGLITDSGWVSFITLSSSSGAPVITSATVSNITQTTAMLNGTVNPMGYNTLVSFFTLSSGPLGTVNIGNGNTSVTIPSFTLIHLTPGTTYQFKVFAANGNNQTTDGQWISFTTLTNSGNQCTTPTISSISPNNVNEGAGATTVTVTGSNFINGTSSAEFSGSPRTTNFSSSTSLTMTLTASDLANSGTKNITVTNGSGCDSNAVTFTINTVGSSGHSGSGSGSSSYNYASVITLNATNTSAGSAILNGTIDPNGHTTTAWFEYGTSSNLSSVSETVHVNQGSGTSASALAQSISGLTPSTTYYFRAVANNTYGTMKGNIYSFTTGVRSGTVTTVQATSQSVTSAKLNGLFINPNGTSASGHFEYGKTASLGNRTADKNLGTSSSVSFSNFVTNLSPNTIYFFRAVVNSQGSANNGNILVFKTSRGIINPTTEPINVEPTVIATESSILKIINEKDNISVGDEINYLVSFKNTDSKNLENVKLSVQLPKEVDFVESNFGELNSDNDLVEFNPGILIADQVGSITIKGKVNSKAQNNNILITTAVMSYNQEGSTETKDEIAYATNHIVEGIGLQANPLFGTNFLPSTILGWLALLLVILGLAIVGKNLYSNYAVKGSGKRTSGDIDNLPM